MKDVQCYELFEGIALKNHAFSFFSFSFSTMNLFQDVIMDLMFTNDGFYFVSYGNDLKFGCVKFHEPYALPFLRLV